MRVLITTTGYYSAEEYKSKLEDFNYEAILDEYGDITKTYIEINSMEDLSKLSEAVDKELIVDFRKSKKNYNDEPFIEIYDDWRE
jgi:hypothetical protein